MIHHHDPIFISYYTPQYSDCVPRLVASLNKFKLGMCHYPIECLGSWHANVNAKPSIIQRAMETFPDRLIVYLDIDAEVVADPVWLKDITNLGRLTIATRKTLNGAILSGTLAFWPGFITQELLHEWRARCEAFPKQWDQISLEQVLHASQNRYNVFDLPENYCHIFDYKGADVVHPAVIVHHQASRTKRRAVGIYRDGPG